MNPDLYLEHMINRQIPYRYSGVNLRFDLSTALFSSAAVDTGTATLLRALAEPLAQLKPQTVLDVGCGTGTLGISLAAASNAELAATDRDALATWITARNADLNEITAVCTPALGTFRPWEGTALAPANLTVCNIPAKAGAPVLGELVRNVIVGTAPGGLSAIVIVTTLADFLRDELAKYDARIVAERETSSHLALVVSTDKPQPAGPAPGLRLPSPYVRDSVTFTGPAGDYTMDTAFNLPEFDSLGYDTELAFRLMTRETPGGRLFIWGSGQGHLATGGLPHSARAAVVLAHRDALAVAASEHNLAANREHVQITARFAPGLAAAAGEQDPGTVDWLIVRSHPEPGSLWAEELHQSALHLLSPGGRLLLVSRSTSVNRAGAVLRPHFSQRASLRNKGFRADLLARKH